MPLRAGEQAVQTREGVWLPDFTQQGGAGPTAQICRCLSPSSGYGVLTLLLKRSWNPGFSGHRGPWVPGASQEGVSHMVTCKNNYSAHGKRLHLT